MAILQASLLPDVHFINAKLINEQQAQSMLKLTEHSVKQKVVLKNQLTGLLNEFNISSGRSINQFVGTIQDKLEQMEHMGSGANEQMGQILTSHIKNFQCLLMAQIGYSLSDLIQLYKSDLADQVKTFSN